MKHLAFDLGGSGGKMFEGNYDGKTLNLREVHRFANAPENRNGHLCWDFPRILEELRKGLSKAAVPGETYTLGIDAFCNDFSLLDAEGNMMCDVRSYRDSRTEECRDEIYARICPEVLYKKTGNQTALFNTFMQLASMRIQGEGELLDRAEKFLFVPDLLVHYIGGEDACEYTLVSVSQLYDQVRKDFDDDILSSFGIRREMFPPVAETGSSGGFIPDSIRQELGIGEVEIIHVCGHDTGCAFLGSTESNSVIMSSGTWTIVGTETEHPLINDYGYEKNFANEGGYPGHQRLLHNVMGTWILQQIQSELRKSGQNMSFSEMAELAAAEKPFRFWFDVDDERFFSPADMTAAVMSKIRENCGRQPETTGALVRSVCESLALKYSVYVQQLEKLTGKIFDSINIIGGGSQNALLSQMTANATGKKVICGPVEATALGNIMIQMIACGEVSGIAEGREIIRRSFPEKIYYPQDTDLWNEYKNNAIM